MSEVDYVALVVIALEAGALFAVRMFQPREERVVNGVEVSVASRWEVAMDVGFVAAFLGGLYLGLLSLWSSIVVLGVWIFVLAVRARMHHRSGEKWWFGEE